MATSSGQPSFRQEIRLELEQNGPNVKGLFLGYGGAGPHGTMRIEGSMAGDEFRFRDLRGTLTGELTVGGDELTGRASLTPTAR